MANIGGVEDYLFVSKNYNGLDGADRMVTEIFSGSYEDVMRYYLIALDAAHFINQQNLRYQLGIFEKGQNSNSVADSLLQALGFNMPERHNIFIIPGHGRLLLPKGWKSFYADWTPPSDDLALLKNYVEQIVIYAHIENYGTSPAPERPFYFMPDAPFVKYEPLVISHALAKWEEAACMQYATALTEEQAKQAEKAAQISRKPITATAINLLAEPAP